MWKKSTKLITKSVVIQKQESHDGPVSLHWLVLGNLFLNIRPRRRTKIGSHEFQQKDFEIFH